MAVKRLEDLAISGKRVLIREDLNVPVRDGAVTSDARIVASLPTIRHAVEGGAHVMVMSHLGRPEEGVPIGEQPDASMAPVAARLAELTGYKVNLVDDYLDGIEAPAGELTLFENIRVNAGEKKNDEVLARRLASLCDIFVMDAFGTAHRAQASTEGVARHAPVACAGPLLSAELDALGRALAAPEAPVLAIVGGSKVSTKLEVLNALADRVDHLVVGGGIANTFIAATGNDVGKSLYEPDLVDTARALLDKVNIPVPTDVVVATEMNDTAASTVKPVNEVSADEMVLDIGPDSAAAIAALVAGARTIIWNGPVGVFEIDAFAGGARALSEAIAANAGFSIAGGGDTLAAIDQFGITDQVSYISTGGGAFLEFVEGKKLPAVEVLERRGG